MRRQAGQVRHWLARKRSGVGVNVRPHWRQVTSIAIMPAPSVRRDRNQHLVYIPLPDVDGRPVLRIVAATSPPEDLDNT
jgi:hypothetical protein